MMTTMMIMLLTAARNDDEHGADATRMLVKGGLCGDAEVTMTMPMMMVPVGCR